MDIFLTRELETWMQECVKTGTYRSEGELVRHALRMLRESEETSGTTVGALPDHRAAPENKTEARVEGWAK